MPFIKWSEQLELGLPEIDRQHRRIAEILNDIFREALSDKPDRERLRLLVRGLRTHIRNHFGAEERMLWVYGHPEAEGHHHQHQRYFRTLEDWCLDVELGRPCTRESFRFMRDWLLYHILKSDKPLIPFLKQHKLDMTMHAIERPHDG